MTRTDGYGKTSRLVLAAALVILIFAVREAQEVLLPVAVAVLLSFLLTPVITRFERWHIKRVPAVILVVLLAFGIIGGFGYLVGAQFGELTNKLPEYQKKIEAKIQRVRSLSGGTFSKFNTAIHGVAKEISGNPPATATAPASQKTAVSPTPQPVDLTAATQPAAPIPVTVVPSAESFSSISEAVGPVFRIGATIFVITVLVIFMSINREDLRDRFIRLVSHGQLNVTTQALDDAAGRVSRYLLMQTIINGSYGVLVGLGLYFIHIPDAALWGLLAGMLRFIPYVGPWIGASMPLLLSVAVFNGFEHLALTAGLFIVIEIATNSAIEPWVYGVNTGVSSIAILLSAVFWAWVWGPVGLLLATPLTVCLVVMGHYVPQMEFLSIMLGDEPVFEPKMRFYQRLLASDTEEATEIVEEAVDHLSLGQAYEHIVLPVLSMAEQDSRRGRLDAEKLEFIRQTVQELIVELEDHTSATTPPQEEARPAGAPLDHPAGPSASALATHAKQRKAALARWVKRAIGIKKFSDDRNGHSSLALLAPASNNPRVSGAERLRVLCLPARDENDELAGEMLTQLLKGRGFTAQSVGVAVLASEMLDLVEKKKADIVVISALPPGAVTHARYLCKRLHARFPQTHVLVGLWNATADLTRARKRIACAGTDRVSTSLGEIIEEIEQLAHVLLLQQQHAEAPVAATV